MMSVKWRPYFIFPDLSKVRVASERASSDKGYAPSSYPVAPFWVIYFGQKGVLNLSKTTEA